MNRAIRFFGQVMVAVVLVASMARPAAAAPFAYAVTTDSILYTVDLATGLPTLIGGTGVFLESIALSPGGQLYGMDVNGNLYSLNAGTGVATLIASSGLGNIEALDFNGNTLVAVDFGDTPTAWSIDTTTAVPTSITTASAATGSVRSGAIESPTTMLIRGDAGLGCLSECLFRLNLTTGGVALIGGISGAGTSLFAAIDFAGGVLYGLNDAGQLYSINTTTAVATPIGASSRLFYLGMATVDQVVPEPATMVLVGSGVLAAFARRRRAS
jgi:hypothetical protein